MVTCKPPRLKTGDTLGVVAPAGHFPPDEFKQGVSIIEKMGFKVKVPSKVHSVHGRFAGSDVQRAAIIHQMFTDPEVQGIVCARGGYGALRVLSRLDYDTIGQHPKCLIGFSDITALLGTLQQKVGLVVFHGPTVTTLPQADEQTRRSWQRALTTPDPVVMHADGGKVIYPGKAVGIVCGGNLTTLCHMLKTPFEPDLRERILVLEDRGEAPYRIDRMLTQLKLAGCFENLKGLCLGAFADCGAWDEVLAVVKDIFEDLPQVPILAGLPIGHQGPNLTLPLGLPATLDTDQQELRYHEAATEDG
jgi:muramoyltetrapeptide carboxypeptidase